MDLAEQAATLYIRRRDEVQQVLELGASLKEAQAGLDRAQLQALGQQRQRLLAAVARQSLEAAAEVGYDVGSGALPGVEQTLQRHRGKGRRAGESDAQGLQRGRRRCRRQRLRHARARAGASAAWCGCGCA